MELYGLEETEEEDVLLTPWSAVHFLSGMAAKDLGIPFWWFEGLHALYETKDQMTVPKTNSFINSVGDQITGTLGHLAGSRTKNHIYVWMYAAGYALAVFGGDRFG